jgi:hypothetical protein
MIDLIIFGYPNLKRAIHGLALMEATATMSPMRETRTTGGAMLARLRFWQNEFLNIAARYEKEAAAPYITTLLPKGRLRDFGMEIS